MNKIVAKFEALHNGSAWEFGSHSISSTLVASTIIHTESNDPLYTFPGNFICIFCETGQLVYLLAKGVVKSWIIFFLIEYDL